MTSIDTDIAVPSPVPERRDAPANVFDDLGSFKADLKEAGLDGAMELLSTVQVRKPPAEEFVRSHPAPDMTITVALHESRDSFTSEYYVILPSMLGAMMELGAAFYAQLYVVTTRSGATMLWPVKLATGGAGNPWFESALKAAETAKTQWIRVYADPGRKHYRILPASGDLEAPEFPDKPLNELLEIAFKGRVIDSEDHPIVRKIRGLV
jgi:hypothetical protein